MSSEFVRYAPVRRMASIALVIFCLACALAGVHLAWAALIMIAAGSSFVRSERHLALMKLFSQLISFIAPLGLLVALIMAQSGGAPKPSPEGILSMLLLVVGSRVVALSKPLDVVISSSLLLTSLVTFILLPRPASEFLDLLVLLLSGALAGVLLLSFAQIDALRYDPASQSPSLRDLLPGRSVILRTLVKMAPFIVAILYMAPYALDYLNNDLRSLYSQAARGQRDEEPHSIFHSSGLSFSIDSGQVETVNLDRTPIGLVQWQGGKAYADVTRRWATEGGIYWRAITLSHGFALQWKTSAEDLQAATFNRALPRPSGPLLAKIVLSDPHDILPVFEGARAVREPKQSPGGTLLARRSYSIESLESQPARKPKLPSPFHQTSAPVEKQAPQALKDSLSKALGIDAKGRARAADLAKRLQQYFARERFTYSLTPGPYPEGDAALEEFLLKRKAGFCEHYAAASASVAILFGLPARVVVGYLQSERPLPNQAQYLRRSDAHAWTEIFDPDSSTWVAFDPTAAVTDLSTRLETSKWASLRLPDVVGLVNRALSRLSLEIGSVLTSFGESLADTIGLSEESQQGLLDFLSESWLSRGIVLALLVFLGLTLSRLLSQSRSIEGNKRPLINLRLSQWILEHMLKKPFSGSKLLCRLLGFSDFPSRVWASLELSFIQRASQTPRTLQRTTMQYFDELSTRELLSREEAQTLTRAFDALFYSPVERATKYPHREGLGGGISHDHWLCVEAIKSVTRSVPWKERRQRTRAKQSTHASPQGDNAA